MDIAGSKKCGVCRKSLNEKDKDVLKLKCNHSLHRQCIPTHLNTDQKIDCRVCGKESALVGHLTETITIRRPTPTECDFGLAQTEENGGRHRYLADKSSQLLANSKNETKSNGTTPSASHVTVNVEVADMQTLSKTKSSDGASSNSTTIERNNTTVKITFTLVVRDEEAVINMIEKCQAIFDQYSTREVSSTTSNDRTLVSTSPKQRQTDIDQHPTEIMTSTATNNNSTATSSQPVEFPVNISSLGTMSNLPLPVNARESNVLSSNRQQSTVATFPQRTSNGAATANTGSPIGSSFSPMQMSGSTPGFSFAKGPSTDTAAPDFSHQPSQNAPPYSFMNASSASPASFNFNASTNNLQVQQSIPSLIFTSSAQKQELSNDRQQTPTSLPLTSTTSPKQEPTKNNATGYASNNYHTVSKKVSDSPTPISQRSSFANQNQGKSTAPASLPRDSQGTKEVNTLPRDSTEHVVDRSDPTSPFYSLKTFEDLNLNPNLLEAINDMGFQTPTRIQEMVIPNLLNEPPMNLIAQSQSGTGKTAAFALSLISRIHPSIQSPQALVLAPTFELAVQIGSVIEKMARYLPYIKIAYAVRDPEKSKRKSLVRGQLLTEPIVVGTPGTVEDWSRKMKVINLNQLRICCVDEADIVIASVDFQKTCVDLFKSLDRSKCLMMLFSATFSDEVMAFAREIIDSPLILRLKREKQILTNIRQFFIRCYDSEQKYHAIEQMYNHVTVGQAFIFCRTKKTAHELAVRMANDGHSVRELTGDLYIEQRASIIEQFRDGIFRVLVATNVMPRGIDVDGVSLVVNYDMPVTTDFQPDYETYVHHIGRSGRFGRLGYTFNLIGSKDDLNVMQAIQEHFSCVINEITVADIANLEQDLE